MADFRKGQTSQSPRPPHGLESHSPWPEAHLLRTGKTGAFPRVGFGLPLEIRGAGNGKIPGTSRDSRLASPAITKAMKVEETWNAGVLILNTADEVSVEGKKINVNGVGFPASIKGYNGSKLVEIQKEGNILKKYLLFLRHVEGFQELK